VIFEKVRTRPNGKSVKCVAEALPNGKLSLVLMAAGVREDRTLEVDPFELDVMLKAIGGLSAKGWKGLNG